MVTLKILHSKSWDKLKANMDQTWCKELENNIILWKLSSILYM